MNIDCHYSNSNETYCSLVEDGVIYEVVFLCDGPTPGYCVESTVQYRDSIFFCRSGLDEELVSFSE